MFANTPERQMHMVRWLLTCGWLLLIFSLFYDPISPWLTDPNNTLSPLRINPEVCVKVQGVCLEQTPYALGARLFWTMIVPAAIFILLVFGHELWRRICPLSFLSQIPRALGWQRQHRRVDPKSGKISYELAKVKKDSWLGRNYLYLQFGLFYLGLCIRLLFVNSDRLALGIFLIFTILSAIAVGYLYGGKSWCQYFCPMAPVQKIYGEPGGLLTSKAHEGDQQTITQSMCRSVNQEGKEQSACVACQSPCIDIDAERAYWDGITKTDQKLLYYGYIGLVISFYFYYYLYAGNWDYYFSGSWTHEANQLTTLIRPGFYLFNNPIPIPKLVAVPLTLGFFAGGSYFLGRKLEKSYKNYHARTNQSLSKEQIQHQIFTLCTFVVFNLFYAFGARPNIALLPLPLQYFYDVLLVFFSTLWLYRTLGRSPDLYLRESFASRLRKQLSKLQLDVSRFLKGHSLESLNPDEVYVLAKILPGFTGEKRLDAYKGVLREALEEGYVNSSNSLEVLQQMRQELDISDKEHLTVLTELGVEDPDLLDPSKQRTRENQVRLQSYRDQIASMVGSKRRRTAKGLGRELLKVVQKEKSIQDVLPKDALAVRSLRREYAITLEEEEKIQASLDEETDLLRRGDILLNQLQELSERYQALRQPLLPDKAGAWTLLQSTVQQKQRLIAKGLLEIIKSLDPGSEATRIALALGATAPNVLPNLLEDGTSRWQKRLSPKINSRLIQQIERASNIIPEMEPTVIVSHLEVLLQEPDSLTQAVSLYMISQLDVQRSQELARQLLDSKLTVKALVRETAQMLLKQEAQPDTAPTALSTIEKLLYLLGSDLFSSLKTENLMELAYQAQVKVYNADEVVIEQGEKGKELLLLINGVAQLQVNSDNGKAIVESLLPGQMLNELEILARTEQAATIVVTVPETRILAIDVDTFDALLCRVTNFARGVLERKSFLLQQLVQQSRGSH
ncbi:MAG: cyclic nucleotide-binding domain-containing protein [Stigonema ocellatum SAG 48.90 = DSM 106950]|nr:cyclic nucleotide-binding domain-containing protein [Stigonema ocellatum SAG 48.90 = DSM 106950]